MFHAPANEAALATYREAGIDRVLFEVPDTSRDEVLRVVDKLTLPEDDLAELDRAFAPGAVSGERYAAAHMRYIDRPPGAKA